MRNETERPGGRDEPDWEVLARYLAGESPAAEAEAVRAWLAERPGRESVLRALDTTLHRYAAAPPAELDVEGALARVHARMDAPETPVIPFRRPEPRPARIWGTPALRIAAALLVMIGGYFAWQLLRGTRAPLAEQAYTTGVGERDSLRLPDGTTVLLGPGSRLTLAPDYGAGARGVELQGEALFDVPHDAARPFTVTAGAARVRDIGTTFSVHSAEGAEVRVVVTSGAVALRAAQAHAEDELVLREGDRGVLAAGRATPERALATAEDLAWTQGRLVFRDAPVAQVAADVRRWYGVELRADDPAVARRRLTASFTNESADDVVRVIALALGAEVAMRGDTAVLHAGAPR
jgi:transmembrane sensor